MAKLNIDNLVGRVASYEKAIDTARPTDKPKKKEAVRNTKVINFLMKEGDSRRIEDLVSKFQSKKSAVFCELINHLYHVYTTTPNRVIDEIESEISKDPMILKGIKVSYSVRLEFIEILDILKEETNNYLYDILSAAINIYSEDHNIYIKKAKRTDSEIKTYNLIRSSGRHDKSNTRIK